MTYGGFVEFNWPDELDSVSANSSTGAFLGPFTGLTSGSDGTQASFTGPSFAAGDPGRHATMAWERQEDLLDLFRSNGQFFDGAGKPVIRGRIMMIYDRGVYIGHFTTLEVAETDDKAFSFELSWEFKVEETVYVFPGSTSRLVRPGDAGSSTTRSPSQLEADLIAGTGAFERNGEDVPAEAAGPGPTNEEILELIRQNQGSVTSGRAGQTGGG